ncbi:MAG TPA: vitamin K epoxide reductase family protein [Candidatus Tumulicola sp.]|jgi:uncharacterized membrane protein
MQTIVTLLCGVGLYTAVFMLGKSIRAARGLLSEPSVVQTRRAQLFGAPNAAIGAAYYALLIVAVWLGHGAGTAIAACIATLLAAATSLYLAYSLLYVTRKACPYCWTGHVINWLLAASCIWGATHGLLFSPT